MAGSNPPEVITVSPEQLEAILERAESGQALEAADIAELRRVIKTLAYLGDELASKSITLKRLRALFGLVGSEKQRTILPDSAEDGSSPASG